MDETAQLPNMQSLGFVEALYEDYLKDPQSIPDEWRSYFAAFNGQLEDNGFRSGPSFKPSSIFNPAGVSANGHAAVLEPAAKSPAGKAAPANGNGSHVAEAEEKQDKVDQLIRSYRVRGHMAAQLDPLGLRKVPYVEELDPAFYGLTDADMGRQFSTDTMPGPQRMKLAEIIERLRGTYCGSIGVQYAHMDELAPKNWIRNRIEEAQHSIQLSREKQLKILTKLTDAVIFESFILKKFQGKKSFSLVGGESLIPLLQLALDKASEHRVKGVVIGMAHRGRLNVLANIIGQNPAEIFREFTGRNQQYLERHGDVKYHLGHSTTWRGDDGREMYVSLCFNPSHLEYVDPVAMGRVRASQDRFGDKHREHGLCIQIHGDAAFIGEGVVQETLNMSQLEGYGVGGTLHVIVNNQLGFTTDPEEGRSSMYSTDIAKMLQSPIFHVNGEDPEAVALVVETAMEFRKQFKRDVFIDLYCYRYWGHNETDEPAFTQPIMYKAIKEHKGVLDSYREGLVKLGGITEEEAQRLAMERRQKLEDLLAEVQKEQEIVKLAELEGTLTRVWKRYQGGRGKDVRELFDTGASAERLQRLLARITEVPEGFTVHPYYLREKNGLLTVRREMAAGERPLDWGAAELLAYATLATEGYRVRVSGQDVERGTFSHRHSVWHDYNTNELYFPLKNLAEDQKPVDVYNSPLSEAGVLGFEFGYTLDMPDALVVWEAQFGDFVNSAQVIVDQFIASAEQKWGYLSGLVLLLPHGFEGLGSEHSSARLERFLMLSAADNIQVCQPTTPAQIFHLLRRQVLGTWRKPLVVMSPKSLLRSPEAVSDLSELTKGRFHRILPDKEIAGREDKVTKLIMCSGKLYYDLARRRSELGREDIGIIRFEQLYPLPASAVKKALAPYKEGIELVWVQEEPRNMGAWWSIYMRFAQTAFENYKLRVVSRPESSSPASGSEDIHNLEQKQLLIEAFAD